MIDDTGEGTAVIETGQLIAALETARNRAYLIVIAGGNVGETRRVEGAVHIGRGEDNELRVLGEGISRRHAQVVVKDDAVYVEDLGSTNGTFLNGTPVSSAPLNDGDKILIGTTTILKFTYHDKLEEDFQKQLYDSALRDGLTGIYNKKHFQERIAAEFSYAQRHKTELALLMLDIDHFKKLNDTYGHLAGDSVLVTFATRIGATIRGEDLFARFGGEEFAVTSRGINAAGAKAFAERIRQTIKTSDFNFSGHKLEVTASIGIAAFPDDDIKDPDALVLAADEALYLAKRAGRNCVVAKSQKLR